MNFVRSIQASFSTRPCSSTVIEKLRTPTINRELLIAIVFLAACFTESLAVSYHLVAGGKILFMVVTNNSFAIRKHIDDVFADRSF